MDDQIGRVLHDALELLRAMDPDAGSAAQAQAMARKWAAIYPDTEVDLVVDRTPGSARVEYDLLLGHPDGGTVALAFYQDRGDPWMVSYSDHWAANYVVTVDERNLTVQEALQELELAADGAPQLLTGIVDRLLVAQAAEPDDRVVTPDELQQAVDGFRHARGLDAAADMVRWLEERRLSRAEFGAIMASTVMSRKVRDRVAGSRVAEDFEARRAVYDRLTIGAAWADTKAQAQFVADRARRTDLWSVVAVDAGSLDPSVRSARLWSGFALDMPFAVAEAATGTVVGPFADDEAYAVAVVHNRRPAALDEQTRERVIADSFDTWLAHRRRQATVTWHWA